MLVSLMTACSPSENLIVCITFAMVVFYCEQIKALEYSDPWLFRRFKMGQWAIQEKPDKFQAIGADMKMEQTLQCVSKGPGGHYVVGLTGNAAAVAEFAFISGDWSYCTSSW